MSMACQSKSGMSDDFVSSAVIRITEVSYRGNLLTTMVQKADFLSSPIAVERVVSEDGEVYKVDWESWVGYCDFTPEEMRSKKPTGRNSKENHSTGIMGQSSGRGM